MDDLYFSRIIKEERKKLKMSQEELSILSGVSLPTIRSIEQGTSFPNVKTLNKILKLFNLTLKVERIDKWEGQKYILKIY